MTEKSNGKSWLKTAIQIAIPIVATLIIGVAGWGFNYTIDRVDKNSDKIADLNNTVREDYVDKHQYDKDMREIKDMLKYLIDLELKKERK